VGLLGEALGGENLDCVFNGHMAVTQVGGRPLRSERLLDGDGAGNKGGDLQCGHGWLSAELSEVWVRWMTFVTRD
jgi:hypothetical protein